MARAIDPPTLAPPKGYSNGVLMDPGRILFVAGQIGWNAESTIVTGGLAEQFEQALRNVLDVVGAAGGSAEHIGRFTIYVTDKQRYLAETKAIGGAYRELMGRHYPAMALVEVADLLEEGALVEIEATAVIPLRDPQ